MTAYEVFNADGDERPCLRCNKCEVTCADDDTQTNNSVGWYRDDGDFHLCSECYSHISQEWRFMMSLD